MAFHEVQFPPLISYGAVGGPQFHTTVLALSSGFERRNVDWSLARAMYDVSQGVKLQSDMDTLIAFFYARMGRAYGFRFKDWTDFNVPDIGATPEPLGVTNGSTAVFQIVKLYGDAAATYTRTILKPVAGTVQVQVAGVPTSNFTVDTTTGLITLGAALASSTGMALTVNCEFDVPCRFDTDEMKVSIEDWQSYTWGSISIVELRASD